MSSTGQGQPTRVEMQILRVLWTRGEATLRNVCDDLSRERRVTPSGIATILKIMVDKDLARIVSERRPQRYAAVRTKEETSGSILSDLQRMLFGGSVSALVRSALGQAKPSKEEVDEVKRLLAEHEGSRER